MDINVNLQINEEDRKKTEAILMEIQDKIKEAKSLADDLASLLSNLSVSASVKAEQASA